LARETLKDFLNKKGSKDTMLSYTRKSGPDGLGKDPGTGEELLDLENDIRGLLGDYVRYIMEEHNSEFIPKPGNEKASSSNRGDDLTIADDQGFEKVFVEQGTELKSKLNEYSNSGKFDDLSTLIDKVGKNFSNSEKLKEIKGRPSGKYGETLSNPTGEDNDIIKATQKSFLKNNRFANVGNDKNSAYVERGTSGKDFEKIKEGNQGSFTSQNRFGTFVKSAPKVNLDSLKSLGASLLLKSSGFSKETGPNESMTVDDFVANIDSITSKNIDENSGFDKIDFLNVRSKYASGFPTDQLGNSTRNGRGDIISDDPNAESSKTYGSTYNTEFTFSKSKKLHRIQAAIAMIAVKNVGKTFYDNVINTLSTSDAADLKKSGEEFIRENPEGDYGPYLLGKSKNLQSKRLSNNVLNSLLTNTNYKYGDAVNRGIEVVFGVSSADSKMDANKVANSKNISSAPGFWIAVARSILKSVSDARRGLENRSPESITSNDLFSVYKEIVESNKFIKFFNVMAIIGDVSLASFPVNKDEYSGRARDVDLMPDSNSIPGKSRKRNGRYKTELSWNQDAPTSMYLLPANIIRAASLLNNAVSGENPVKGMFGSKLVENTYTGLDVDGDYNRIPGEVVKAVEDSLEAEYVPFYFQDLRTNEIISFNAFLHQLTDTISPNYTGVQSYGRMDAVQVYQGTTRSLQVGFTIYATNREDFDSMWYKINKFVTLLYPQWTAGTMVSNGGDSKFYQPFSQVVGASPIVRMRIGDIIKSNYSKFGLARLFGIGDINVNARPKEGSRPALSTLTGGNAKLGYDFFTEIVLKAWLVSFGSPQSTANFGFSLLGEPPGVYAKIGINSLKKAGMAAISDHLSHNIFANPWAVNDLINALKDPNTDPSNPKLGYSDKGSANPTLVYLKPNFNKGYFSLAGKKYLVDRKIKVRILEKNTLSNLGSGLSGDTICYKVVCVDPTAPAGLFESMEELVVRHEDIYPDPELFFRASAAGLSLAISDPTMSAADLIEARSNLTNKAISMGVPGEVISDLARSFLEREESFFMRPEVNPYVRAFESTKGRGLAGVIKSVNFDWLSDFPWETDFNSRAPVGVKITFGFDVIHDLPPGMDHTGYNKSPLYNVGGVMRNISGDPYYDGGKRAEFNFNKKGSETARTKNGKNK